MKIKKVFSKVSFLTLSCLIVSFSTDSACAATQETTVPCQQRTLFSPLDRFRQEMRFFFNDRDAAYFEASLGGYAKLDVMDTDADITVSVELPGMDEKAISISLLDTVLTIEGEKKSDYDEKKENVTIKERSYGSFKRVLTLPCEAQVDKITATFKNGVLTIKIPKAKRAKDPKKIPINV